jgi:phosphate transport system substrate-binding protein
MSDVIFPAQNLQQWVMKTIPLNPAFPSKHLSSVLMVLLFAALAGCGKQQSSAPQKVVIKGSNTVGEELAPRLIAEYKKDHPRLTIDLETRGTGSGFYGLFVGACDIATASRGMLTNEEAQAKSRSIQLNDNVIGSYAVAVIVNSNNPVANLTREQVRDIFLGTTKNWKEVGGPDAPIRLYIRDPISGTYLGFRELAMEDKAYATNSVTAFTNYAKIAEAVGKDRTGIGYCNLQLAGQSGTKGVSIGGVAPTAAAVNEKKYPYARVLHFFTNKGAEAAPAKEFIQFTQSAQGKQVLEQAGFVPPS